jgi:NitT/TauT family transport system substrate-binding protein
MTMRMDRQRFHPKHKKIVRILSAGFLSLVVLLAGCSPKGTSAPTTTAAEKTRIRIAALKGPTGIGLVKLMADQELGKTVNDYEVSLFGSPDEIVAQISSKQVDVAALPTNLAAVLYQKTQKQVKLLAINTLGVLYILENGDSVRTLSDLSDKVIVASGKGAVPEYVLNDLLDHSDLAKPARVEYKSEHTEVMTLAAAGEADLVMLPEPFVTTLLGKNKQFRIAFDLTAEWKKIHQKDGTASELSMGCLIVDTGFADEHPAALNVFLGEYKASADYANEHADEAGGLVAKYGILADAVLAAKAIPNCHIVMINGSGMQPALEPFLKILLGANPAAVGGKLPGTDFYWLPVAP